MIKYTLKIIDIIEEAKGTKTYLLEKPEEFNWDEGSHTHIGLLGFDEGEKPNKNLVRHMSIMSSPDEKTVGITTRVPGSSSEFKNKLSVLNKGDEVVIFKVGSRMSLRRCNRPIILLSMGVGIATMRPLIRSFVNDKSDIPFLVNMNVDSSGEFVYKNELEKLTNDCYKNYWIEARGDFYETLSQIAETKNAIFYVIGSDVFIKDMIQQLRANNVNDSDIILDKKDEKVIEFFAK